LLRQPLHLRRDGREPLGGAGAQKFSAGRDDPAKLAYGQSITDGCVGWDDSLEVLKMLSAGVQARRAG
jgi:3-deoxy-7-phosphoheptulonate synthase